MEINRINQTRDKITKSLNRNLKLLAWLCWSQDILFSDYSYQEMYNYLEKTTEHELSQFIKPVKLRIFAKDESGFILDNNFGLYDEHALQCYLNIEDQLNRYPKGEIDARSTYYSCGIIFWQGEKLQNKKEYRKIKPVTSIWIFPKSPIKLENSIIYSNNALSNKADIVYITENETKEPKEIDTNWKTEINIIYYNLGNPVLIQKRKKDKRDKQWYSLILMDTLFGLDVEEKIRYQILKNYFNLEGLLIKEVIKEMNALEQFAQENFNEGKNEGKIEGIEEGFGQGVKKGIMEEKQRNLEKLAQNLVNQSGNKLSMEEALKQAKELLS